MTQYRQAKYAGFTIVELMIVVAIMGVVAAIGYPGMQKQIAQQRLKEAVNITETMLRQARTDAIISRSDVTAVITTNTPQSITLTQSINGVNQIKTQSYNPNIVMTSVSSMPTTIRFTADKRVYQGATGTTVLATNSNMGYAFCYTGQSSERYLVTVDAMTNVRVTKSGDCL